MDKLVDLIGRAAAELHRQKGKAIAKRLLSLDGPDQFARLKYDLFPTGMRELADSIEAEWNRNTDISQKELSCLLLGAVSGTLNSTKESFEIVWTGPSTPLVPIRHTEQVLCEIIDSSIEDVFIVSFVSYKIDSLLTSLLSAIKRGVRVSFLVESSIEHGGKISVDSIGTLKKTVPGATIYCWDTKDNDLCSVHAKCAIVDSRVAFVTSANLTSAAMEHNMELGILIRDGNVPIDLRSHFGQLINTGVINEV